MHKKKPVRIILALAISTITAFGGLSLTGQDIDAAANIMRSSDSPDYRVVDLSQYNDSVQTSSDDINFATLKTQVDAVYIRSYSHANNTFNVDMQAVKYAKSAKKAGLKFGFYFYFLPTASLDDAKTQAHLFYDFIKDYSYALVPVLDVEDNSKNISKAQLAAAVKAFTDEFTAISGQPVMIYTFPYFMKNNFDTSFKWSQYKLWIAHYNVSAPMEGISSSWMPESLWCWSRWDMWQYTSTGTLSSVPNSSGGALDLSYATKNIFLSTPSADVSPDTGAPTVSYQTHVQDYGWQNWRDYGDTAGTSGQSKRLEAIRIMLDNTDGGIQYRTHVQDYGWMDWTSDGLISGTSGQSKRLEAIEIKLTGVAADLYDVYYRVHAQNFGWMDWAKNGESAGTAGFSYRLEAIQIVLVAKGGVAPGETVCHFVNAADPGVVYTSYVQDYAWMAPVENGALSGTSGESKRLEALNMTLANVNGGIEYSAHVQDYGWMDWVSNGQTAGTLGQAKRLEAIKIRLTGDAATKYDVYYRIHAQNYGWLDWASNGAPAGTAGFSYRVEAVKVVLVPKGQPAPGETLCSFVDKNAPGVVYSTSVQDIGWMASLRNGAVSGTTGQAKRVEAMRISLANLDGGIEYHAFVQNIGWQAWVTAGNTAGTEGQSLRMEAMEMRLTGNAASQYDLYYKVYIQNMGWLDWAKNSAPSGTTGCECRIEAIRIVLVPKGGAAPGATANAFIAG